MIAYGGKIIEQDTEALGSSLDRYTGWDERVWGNEIITILRGSRKYSDYDIAPFIEKLKWKKEYMQTTFPDKFGTEDWDVDVDLLFIDRLDCQECHMPLRIMRTTDCDDGGCDVIGHCVHCLRDWQWHCDKQGWATAMQRFFHG